MIGGVKITRVEGIGDGLDMEPEPMIGGVVGRIDGCNGDILDELSSIFSTISVYSVKRLTLLLMEE